MIGTWDGQLFKHRMLFNLLILLPTAQVLHEGFGVRGKLAINRLKRFIAQAPSGLSRMDEVKYVASPHFSPGSREQAQDSCS